jgi:hypothetical protein
MDKRGLNSSVLYLMCLLFGKFITEQEIINHLGFYGNGGKKRC